MSEKKAIDAAVFEEIRALAREKAASRIDGAIEMFLDKIVQEEIRKAVRSVEPLSNYRVTDSIRTAMKERIKIEVERQVPSIEITVTTPGAKK